MKVLITGGAGFIGSHLCERYINKDHTVFCLDNFSTGNILNIRHLLDFKNFKLIKGDILDKSIVNELSKEADVVFHLAAQIHVDKSYIEPRLTYDVNVKGTQNILEAARMYDVKKVIYASSSEVYGTAQKVPMDENHLLNPPHPYGASKLAADRMCNAYMKTYGMNIKIIRSFNTFGPRQRSIGYGGVISIFTRRVLNNLPPIIYGQGLQSRDYTYVDDIINAYESIESNPNCGPVNLGTGRDIKIKDLAQTIIDISGKKLKAVHIEPRIGEIDRLIADTTKAKEILGWEAKISLEEGLKKYYEWYGNFGSEFAQGHAQNPVV